MRKEELSPGTECLLKPERNMYWDDERHKWSEIANNWNCLYCGKSFYNEQFLDKHYDNRHGSTVLTGPEAVCLADHCDYLRCDIIASTKKTSFWEEALCKQKDLLVLRKKCQNIMKSCIPSHITDAEKNSLLDKLDDTVCSFLTCEKYWENPYKEVPPSRTAAYFIAGIFTVFGFIMYYVMACSHLYADEKEFLGDSDGFVRERSKLPDSRRYVSYPTNQGQSIRNRQGMVGDR
eukprot:XP_003730770.1 PREDICTED: uncharacterized protein LOC100893077 [Strongylocentrotus purpuratus]